MNDNNDALKVAMIPPGCLPIPPEGAGAVEGILLDLVPALGKKKVRVSTPTPGSPATPNLFEVLSKPLRGPLIWKHMKWGRILQPWLNKREGDEIWHTHGQFVAKRALKSKKGRKVVFTSHNFAWLLPKKSSKKWARLRTELKIIQDVDKVVAVSSELAEYIAKGTGISRSHIEVIPNPVPLDVLELSLTRERARAKLGVSENELRIIQVGRNHPYKGFDLTLRAWEIVSSSTTFSEVKLCLIGPDTNKLVKLPKNVSALGSVSRERLLNEMSAADMILLPSRAEGFPILGLEALGMARCIVASDIGPICELLGTEPFDQGIKIQECGIQFNSGSAFALAEAMRITIDMTREERDGIGKNGHTRVTSKYSIESIAERHIEMYHNL